MPLQHQVPELVVGYADKRGRRRARANSTHPTKFAALQRVCGRIIIQPPDHRGEFNYEDKPQTSDVHSIPKNFPFRIGQQKADHIVPWHKGGKTEPKNRRMLCMLDNRTKSGK